MFHSSGPLYSRLSVLYGMGRLPHLLLFDLYYWPSTCSNPFYYGGDIIELCLSVRGLHHNICRQRLVFNRIRFSFTAPNTPLRLFTSAHISPVRFYQGLQHIFVIFHSTSAVSQPYKTRCIPHAYGSIIRCPVDIGYVSFCSSYSTFFYIVFRSSLVAHYVS